MALVSDRCPIAYFKVSRRPATDHHWYTAGAQKKQRHSCRYDPSSCDGHDYNHGGIHPGHVQL